MYKSGAGGFNTGKGETKHKQAACWLHVLGCCLVSFLFWCQISSTVTASPEVKYNLRIEMSDHNYISCHVFLASNCLNFTNEMQEVNPQTKGAKPLDNLMSDL